MNMSLSPFATENLLSRDEFGTPVPRQRPRLDAQAESGVWMLETGESSVSIVGGCCYRGEYWTTSLHQ